MHDMLSYIGCFKSRIIVRNMTDIYEYFVQLLLERFRSIPLKKSHPGKALYNYSYGWVLRNLFFYTQHEGFFI